MKHYKNIKDQISKIKISVRKSKIIIFLFVFFIILFLTFNVISSQSISPLYFNFVNNNEPSTISFLKKIKTLPDYKYILDMNTNLFGSSVKVEILRQENQKKDMINNLEQQLDINPKSRDVLYSLYRLNLSEGNHSLANDYLRKAKEVDPSLK